MSKRKHSELSYFTDDDDLEENYYDECSSSDSESELNDLNYEKNIIKTVNNRKKNKCSFDENLKNLEEWVYVNKKKPSMRSENEEEKRLWKFVKYQKYKIKNDKIRKEKKIEFEKIPFINERKNSNFEGKLLHLKEWKQKNNNKLPKLKSNDSEEKKLAKFVSRTKSSKDEKKIELLNEIYIIERCITRKSFDENYENLKKWIEKNGKVPKLYGEEEEKKLAQFIKSHNRVRSLSQNKNKIADLIKNYENKSYYDLNFDLKFEE